MIEPQINEQDSELLKELEKHAGEWVALLKDGKGSQAFVGSGATIEEARQEAEANGHTDFFLYKVRSEPPESET